MIVVFVVDTSPSMSKPVSQEASSAVSKGMSRLDLAKMAVESLAKGLNKRVMEHNLLLQQETTQMQNSLHNLGLGFCSQDQFLLLSTSRQHSEHPVTAACGAGGRLLVGYGDSMDPSSTSDHPGEQASATMQASNQGGFDRELKQLQAAVWQPPGNATAGAQPQRVPFPEGGGGAVGLNKALSAGLHLLSRYRLQYRSTENFGMGRLPSPAMRTSGGGSAAVHALQPACLVLVTDGECLRLPPSDGGGSLQLQVGTSHLREFYKEPFRWDQRIFCLCVGAKEGVSSTQYLHSSLKALCEVTGGRHTLLKSATSLSQTTKLLIKLMAPPRPSVLPILDPLDQRPVTQSQTTAPLRQAPGICASFVNGGPICCFRSIDSAEHASVHRAMLLYVPYNQVQTTLGPQPKTFHPPIFCIPESFFPSKKLDTLPPRLAQPSLAYTHHYQVVGSSMFDPLLVIKAINRLDQLLVSNRHASPSTIASGHQNQATALLRDTYICEWLAQDGKGGVPIKAQREYLPVCVRGAGRSSLSEGEESFLGIGILHIPRNSATLQNVESSKQGSTRLSTLTLLPPEPHILLPLLVKAAEAEHRAIKKSGEKECSSASANRSGATAGLIHKQTGTNTGPRLVQLDEHWRSEFRAYLFRVPPYYQISLRRCLRSILPTSVHSLLSTDGIEALASQCFSKVCLQKIRGGEQAAKEMNERLERQEAELRLVGGGQLKSTANVVIGYGRYDPRASTSSFLAAIRNMPAPWHAGRQRVGKNRPKNESSARDATSNVASTTCVVEGREMNTTVDVLGALPASCLIPYYESRRRWIFGGSGLATRGLHVEGVNNDGSNAHYCKANHCAKDESLLSVAGVGVSTLNQTRTTRMGDFRERLLWSRAPVVGYGSNDSSGSAATTAPDGSPIWSVDDDAMPLSFFDLKTGEFSDSVQTRVRSRLMVNFGNPYKDKRGDSLVPDIFSNQRPPLQHEKEEADPRRSPGSPPHDTFSSAEGEGEAIFADALPPARKRSSHVHSDEGSSRKRERESTPERNPASKRQRAATETHEGAVQRRQSGPCDKKVTARPVPPPPPQHRKPPPPSGRPPPPPPPPTAKQAPPLLEQSAAKRQKPSFPPPPPKPKKTESLTSLPDMQMQEKKPQVDLPQGWICVWSKSQKRWYFFDTKTNKSVWEWPPPGGIPH